MQTVIALLGAGGKMGVRLAKNLRNTRFEVRHVEVSEVGRQRLRDEAGIECVDQTLALDNANVVVLAIPDTLIGKVAAQIAPHPVS